MKVKKILAYVMTVFMLISMLPSMAFASENGTELGGELKIKGDLIVGSTLSAKYEKVTPENVNDDMVAFQWTKVSEDDYEWMKEHKNDPETIKTTLTFPDLGTKKEYELKEEDAGFYLILTITGKEEAGLSGSLYAVTKEVIAPAEEIVEEEIPEEEEQIEDIPEEEIPVEEEPEVFEEEIAEEIPEIAYEEEPEVQEEDIIQIVTEEEYSSEDVETVPEETEEPEALPEEEPIYEVEVKTYNLEEILDFGTVSGEEEIYLTIDVTNTGNTALHFAEISPEHFMVQDITEPLLPGETVTLWITPRAGLEDGVYEDVISYVSEEGIKAEVTAKAVLGQNEEEKEDVEPADDPGKEIKDPEELTDPEEITDPEEKEEEPEKDPEENPEEEPEKDPEENPEEEPEEDPEITEPFEITEEEMSIDFGTWIAGTSVPLPKNVEVSYVCPENFEALIQILCTNEYFNIVNEPSEEVPLPEGENSFSFAVVPAENLEEGIYHADVQIYLNGIEDENLIKEIPVTAAVEEGTISLSADPEEIHFAKTEEGYTSVEEQSFALTNTGNTAVTLAEIRSDYFVFSETDGETLQPGDTVKVYVQPAKGLGSGMYTENVSVYVWNRDVQVSLANVNITIEIQKKQEAAVKIQSITAPGKITGIPNGTAKEVIGKQLPATVEIVTTKGNMTAKVTWDLEKMPYDPSSADAQNFTVSGVVTLPDGVENPDNVSLKTGVNVSVEGYKAKEASADKNQIKGIDGGYTTASKITFSAIGAGMDNTNPGKGDTRFVPESWSVVNTYKWEKAPYTAAFGMAKAGKYNLSVVFKQQKYNGKTWEDTGVRDTKSVPFTVEQAVVSPTSVPGQSLTPAANKPAVNTGDSSPVGLLIVLMAAAAAAMIGVLVYRSKKN